MRRNAKYGYSQPRTTEISPVQAWRIINTCCNRMGPGAFLISPSWLAIWGWSSSGQT